MPSDTDAEGRQVFDYFINVDNNSSKTVQKDTPANKAPRGALHLRHVLVGLALLHDHADAVDAADDASPSAVEVVGRTSRLLAPVILPMIDELAALTEGAIAAI